MKVLDVQVGQKFAVALTQDSQGKKYLYGLGKQINEYHNGRDTVFPNRFGKNAKTVFGSCIHQITDVDAESVQSFACSKNAVFYVLQAPSKVKVSPNPT